eukprot:358229-Chlamydomonas_euryale.AAC.5
MCERRRQRAKVKQKHNLCRPSILDSAQHCARALVAAQEAARAPLQPALADPVRDDDRQHSRYLDLYERLWEVKNERCEPDWRKLGQQYNR